MGKAKTSVLYEEVQERIEECAEDSAERCLQQELPQLPHMKGIIFKEETRSDSYDRFIECTNEKEVFAKAIKKIITRDQANTYENGKKKEGIDPSAARTLLDIGAGKGILTELIKNQFTSITIIEPDNAALPELKKKVKFCDCEIINSSLEQIIKEGLPKHLPGLPQQYYMVLLDYSLHYSKEYETTLKSLVGFTQPAGHLVIICTADKDEKGRKSDYATMLDMFSQRITGKERIIPSHDYLIGILKDEKKVGLKLEPDIQIIKTEVVLPSVQAAVELCDFYFDAPKYALEPDVVTDLKKFFASKQRGYDGKIAITYHHAFIHCKIEK